MKPFKQLILVITTFLFGCDTVDMVMPNGDIGKRFSDKICRCTRQVYWDTSTGSWEIAYNYQTRTLSFTRSGRQADLLAPSSNGQTVITKHKTKDFYTPDDGQEYRYYEGRPLYEGQYILFRYSYNGVIYGDLYGCLDKN